MKGQRGKNEFSAGRAAKLILLKIPALLIALSLLWVLSLKWLPVLYTPLMLQRSLEYRKDENFKTLKTWKSLKDISPEMVKAVIASEDNLFSSHNGFDWKSIDKAISDHKRGKRLRGASTISQQTAKNVFLFPERTFARKGLEAYFTVLIELFWGKERIMEVYLNVAEMGRGIYGAEAAAQTHFGHAALKLSRREACLIAASLPNPLRRDAGKPSAYVSKRAYDIAALENKLEFPSWVKN